MLSLLAISIFQAPSKMQNNQIHENTIQLCKQLDFLFMDYPWTDQQWQDLSLKDYLLITAGESGFCLAQLNPIDCSAHLLKVAVSSESRKKGIARSLLRDLIKKLQKNGLEKLFLEVNTSNYAAIALYKSTGASILNTVKSYYSDGGDCHRMFYQL